MTQTITAGRLNFRRAAGVLTVRWLGHGRAHTRPASGPYNLVGGGPTTDVCARVCRTAWGRWP